MSKKTLLIVGLLLIAVSATAFIFMRKPAQETTLSMPDLSPRAGETTPSPEFIKAQATLTKFRDDLKQHPQSIKDYVEVAQIYLQEARVTGKHHQYLPIAGNVLDAALKIDPKSFDPMILKASMEMTLHQFQKAHDLASNAIAQNPYSSFAYGVLCDADVELGHYPQAASDVDSMMHLRPDLRSYARASYLREINGDRPGAIQAMKMAADAGLYGQENREWALYNLANIFLGEGDLPNAEHIYSGILEERPSYAFAMSGLAQVAADKGDYPTATELLVKASQLSPEHIFIEQLADIYHATGDAQAEKAMDDKALDAFKLHEEGGWNVDRELAAFLLNHNLQLPEALTRAKTEYEKRPSNIDALDTYAWALYANGKSQDALPIITQAMRLNTQNGLLHYHAAMIQSALGHKDEAAREIKTAFDETPYLNPASLAGAKKLRSLLMPVASLEGTK